MSSPGKRALIVVDVQNGSALNDLSVDDVVEVPCVINRDGPVPIFAGTLPGPVRELVLSVKEYERLTIKAAVEQSMSFARSAMKANPLIRDLEYGDLSTLFF